MVAIGHLAYPYLYDALIAIAYALMLPPIAVLHPRHGRVRESGTILATISGIAAVTVGLAASVSFELRPAALVILGVWWWTIGKMWAETEILPRVLGLPTAALGALTIAAGFLASLEPLVPGSAALGPVVWAAAQAALGVWLLAFGATLMRDARAG